MKKINKLLAAALAVGMMVPMASTSAFAATKTGTTDVSYDNTNIVPDPGNPDNPDWGVSIPSSIVFTDANKKVDASVELVSINGGTLPATDVTITVASQKAYKLNTAANDDEMSYALIYGNKTMTAVANEVGKLKAGTVKVTGQAVLTGTAKKIGSHTDLLTYTISHI